MKKALLIPIVALLLFTGPACRPGLAASWSGVDETVIERVAEKAGRPAREPFINTDQGNLLLFVFLIAGAAAGFAAGYWFRTLFPPRREANIKRRGITDRQDHHDTESTPREFSSPGRED